MSEQALSFAIGRALVESLAWLLMGIDEAPDDVMDLDTAVQWQEDACRRLWRLSTHDRKSLAALCRTLAEEVTDDPRTRRALLLLIRGCDLEREHDS